MVARLFKLHADLQMCHGIRGHQKLEPKDPAEQMAGDIPTPRAFLRLEFCVDLLDHGVEERCRSDCRIEDQRVLVGETLRASEMTDEQLINRTNDVADNRMRRVEHTELFSKGRVISGKEGLVEMDNGIFLALSLRKILQHAIHVGVPE